MTKQSYFWATPSGPINLIEGDKMPPEPIQTNGWGGKDYRENAFNNSQKFHYEQALQSAKESSVPIQDQEKARLLIVKSNSKGWYHDAGIYGPFSLRYEIRYRTHKGTPIRGKLYLEEGGQPPEDLKEGIPYAILYDDTPENEESQESLLDELVTDIFEIGKEAILEKFTITRKQ